MPSKHEKFKPSTIKKGQFFSIDANFLRIGFNENHFILEFGNGTNGEKDSDNIDVDSSVIITMPSDAICGLTSVLTDAYESYKNKYENSKKDTEEIGIEG